MYKKAEDHLDDGLLRMRSIEIWEAQEWMERGASDRDNSATFLVSGSTAAGDRMRLTQSREEEFAEKAMKGWFLPIMQPRVSIHDELPMMR
jgi:hypothetical protein